MFLTEEVLDRATSSQATFAHDPSQVLLRILSTTANSWWEGGLPPVRGRRRKALQAHLSQLAERGRHALAPVTPSIASLVVCLRSPSLRNLKRMAV